jgi:CheY-like chemotaxis protein
MPVMDGRRFLNAMRRLLDKGLAATPVIVLTGSHATASELLLDVEDVLRKPIAVEQLIAKLQVYCTESGCATTT